MHKTKLILTTLLLFPLMTVAQQQQEAEPNIMSLAECLEYAGANATEIENAMLDIRIANASVGEVRAQGLPQINGQGDFTWNYRIQQVFLPAFIVGGGDNSGQPVDPTEVVPVQFGTAINSSMAVNARQLLFDGVFFLGLKAANVYKELASKSYDQSVIDVKANVVKAYYAVLVNQERLDLLQSNYDRLEILLAETLAMYENGFAEKIDVDRIKVNFNNIKVDQQRLARALQISKSLLKFQMGMPLEEEVVLSQTLADMGIEEYLPVPPVDFSYGDRIEFSLLETQAELDELNVRQYRSGYLPKLYLTNTLGWNAGGNDLDALSDWFGFGFMGLSLEIPIFDGFRKKHQIDQANLELQKTRNNREQLKQSVNLEIKQNYSMLLSSIESLQAQKENMELAEEVFRVAKVKYQEGVGSNLEVVEAENAFKQSETNYYNALYDALVYRVDYNKALGRIDAVLK